MSLAHVRVSETDFQLIHDHLTSHLTPSRKLHGNMHMRQTRIRDGVRQLRYLHAMFAPSVNEIDGAISGPDAFWRYRIKVANGRANLQVLDRVCSPREDARIQRQFLNEVLDRVSDEQAGDHPPPKLTPGEFYLRRRMGGMPPSHATCQLAVAMGVLDQRFVSHLRDWNLALLHP